jgi:hypothetical protein
MACMAWDNRPQINTTHRKFGTMNNFHESFFIPCKVVIYLRKQLNWLGFVNITAEYTAIEVCTD